MKNIPLTNRILLSTLLGTGFGLLCFFGFTQNQNIPAEILPYAQWSFSNPMMWLVIINRMTIGAVIGMVGSITHHPMFGFPIPSWLRGLKIGVLISLPMAIGGMINQDAETAWKTFWIITIAGGVIGAIIDSVVTKVVGNANEVK